MSLTSLFDCIAGLNTLVVHNTCEDSLLAAPVMIDLVILTELFQRIFYKTEGMVSIDAFVISVIMVLPVTS